MATLHRVRMLEVKSGFVCGHLILIKHYLSSPVPLSISKLSSTLHRSVAATVSVFSLICWKWVQSFSLAHEEIDSSVASQKAWVLFLWHESGISILMKSSNLKTDCG